MEEVGVHYYIVLTANVRPKEGAQELYPLALIFSSPQPYEACVTEVDPGAQRG